MFGNNREQIRRFFYTSWQKQCSGAPLDGIEALIVQVIQQHPEYHHLLDKDTALDKDFATATGEANPFLHMGMHITLAEQLGANRPPGVRDAYRHISDKLGDAHQAEHQMMECLELALWEAQARGKMPDEQAYLQCLGRLAAK